MNFKLLLVISFCLVIAGCSRKIYNCASKNAKPEGFYATDASGISSLRDGWHRVYSNVKPYTITDGKQSLYLEKSAVIGRGDILDVNPFSRDEEKGLDIVLKKAATKKWEQVTTEHQNQYIAFILGGQLINVQKIGEPVTNGKMAIFAEPGVDLNCVRTALISGKKTAQE